MEKQRAYTRVYYGIVDNCGINSSTRERTFTQAKREMTDGGAFGMAIYETPVYDDESSGERTERILLRGPWKTVSKQEAQRLHDEEGVPFIWQANTDQFCYSPFFQRLAPKEKSVIIMTNWR